MRLYGAETDAEIIGDLFVEHPCDDPIEDRLFSRREQIKTRSVTARGVNGVAAHNVRFERPSQCLE